METYILEFIEHARTLRGFSPPTLKGYRCDLRMFARWLHGEHDVSEPGAIKREHIERYDVMHGKANKRPQTRRRKISAIRAFTAWLYEYERIPSNPAVKLKLPALDDPTRTAPTPAEKDALFDGCARLENAYDGSMAVTMLACMFYAGLRPMEVIALNLGDVDLAQRRLTVQKGKGGKYGQLPINETLAAYIVAWLPIRKSDRNGSRLLTTDLSRGMTYYVLRTTFNRVKIAGGLRDAKHLTAHCLRHWFASTLRANNMDLLVIQKLMRHQNLASTQTYLHVRENELDDAVRGLDSRPSTPKKEVKKHRIVRRF